MYDITEVIPLKRTITSTSGFYWPTLDLMWFTLEQKKLKILSYLGEYSHSLLSATSINLYLCYLEEEGTNITDLILNNLRYKTRLKTLKKDLLINEIALRRLLKEWEPLQQAHEAYTIHNIIESSKFEKDEELRRVGEAYITELIKESSEIEMLYKTLVDLCDDDPFMELLIVCIASNVPLLQPPLIPEDFVLGMPDGLKPIKRIKNLANVLSSIKNENSISHKRRLFYEALEPVSSAVRLAHESNSMKRDYYRYRRSDYPEQS